MNQFHTIAKLRLGIGNINIKEYAANITDCNSRNNGDGVKKTGEKVSLITTRHDASARAIAIKQRAIS